MSKKIIAVSVCIVLVAVAFAACGKKKNIEAETTTTSLEYTTDTDGNQFVTNINGELIPVTTGTDGSVEFYDDLITKTGDQVKKEKEEMDKDKDKENNNENGGGNNNGENNVTTTTKPTEDTGKVVIGNDDVKNDDSHDAVIDWGA